MKNLVQTEYPESDIQSYFEDGINETCIFDSEGQRYVAKIFTSDIIDVQNYLGVIELSRTYVHNTEYLHTPDIQDSGIFDGSAYVVYKYIRGDQLEFESVKRSEKTEEYLKRIGQMLSDLRTISNPVDGFGWYTYKDGEVTLNHSYDNSTDMVLSYLDYNLEQMDDEVFVQKYGDRIRRAVQQNIGYDGEPCIGHCDVKYNNVIESNGNLHLIDWEFARSLDPMYEYVKAERQLIDRYPPEFEENRADELRDVFRSAYFDSSESFSRRRYLGFRVHEMTSQLRECHNWYPDEMLDEVQSHHKDRIKQDVERIL